MNHLVFPVLLVMALIALISAQCTFMYPLSVWGLRLELLPPLILYAAFTVNLQMSLLFALLAAALYDSFSGCRFGASLIPYVTVAALGCTLRPVFFRNRVTTQFISGLVFCWLAIAIQWALSGKALVSWHIIFPKLARLSLFCGVLAVCYFTVLDFIARSLGQEPGRFDQDS